MGEAKQKKIFREAVAKEASKAYSTLDVKEGQILIVKSMELINQLIKLSSPTGKPMPIIFDPSGSGIQALNRQQLVDALTYLDEIDALEQ